MTFFRPSDPQTRSQLLGLHTVGRTTPQRHEFCAKQVAFWNFLAPHKLRPARRPQGGKEEEEHESAQNSIRYSGKCYHTLWHHFETIEKLTNTYTKKEFKRENRVGDHIWYISNMKKFKSHYPKWKQVYNSEKIISQLLSKRKF